MTTPRLACRIVATWSEGDVPVREGFHDAVALAAGDDVPAPPDAIVRQAAERTAADGELAAAIRLARERRLPSIYEPDGMSFSETAPVYIDHGGPEVGRVLVITRTDDRFEALGWIHPDYAQAARARAHISPGLWIDDAELVSFAGVDALRVTRSTLGEMSITGEPSRAGTVLQVGPPRLVPEPDWTALHEVGSIFYALETDRLRFAAAHA